MLRLVGLADDVGGPNSFCHFDVGCWGLIDRIVPRFELKDLLLPVVIEGIDHVDPVPVFAFCQRDIGRETVLGLRAATVAPHLTQLRELVHLFAQIQLHDTVRLDENKTLQTGILDDVDFFGVLKCTDLDHVQ